MDTLTLADLLRAHEARLTAVGVETPSLDARLLTGAVLGLDRTQMFVQPERPVSADERARIESLIARRSLREPVARILGEREFWSLPFGLNESTLDPRPDSETLIEQALKNLGHDRQTQPLCILDLGTGSGCLLIALLSALPHATGLGIDIAPRALSQARVNAARNGVSSRAVFRSGNWLDGMDDFFDIIISNPPYIPRGDIARLEPDVRDFDPLQALDGGADGLDIYRALIPPMLDRLKPSGFVVLEVGVGQARTVADLLDENGFVSISIHQDYGGIERCLIGHNRIR